MKKQIWTVLLAVVTLLLPQFILPKTVLAEEKKTLDLLFTHDLHSHLDSFSAMVDGEVKQVGGYSRIKTLVDAQKKKNPNTLFVDAGDFSMGTLVQTVYEQEAAELRVMGDIGCEVTTLGNHEFDYLSKGLANMMDNAAASGDALPQMVVCNVDWEAMEAAGLSEGQKLLADSFAAYGVKDYIVLEKGNVRAAVVGVFGKDSLACAPTCELLFSDPVEAVKKTVAEIEKNEAVDLIICVSHSGIWEDEDKSEDEILAKRVPELDIIVSGHTHTELAEPIVHGTTSIVSVGEYGKKLGSLSMEQQADGSWSVTNYELIPVTADILPDESVQQRVDHFFAAVDTEYLADFGYTQDQVLAQNDVVFSSLDEISNVHTEHNLGNIMSDAYAYAVEHAADFDGTPVDVAVVPSGTVRDTYVTGEITATGVYNTFSLGIGADGVPGYPLISVYLTGEELRIAAEIDASLSDLMTTTRLYLSGMHFSFNPNRMMLNKVTDLYLVDENGNRRELEDGKLYRVVADLYTGQMLNSVTDLSYGLLSVVPKFADGTPIVNFNDAIIKEDGKELKAWDAIARYMLSFPDTDGDGIANVPEYYSANQGRKVVEDSKHMFDLLKNPSKYALLLVGVAAILLAVIVGAIIAVKRRVRKGGSYGSAG